MLLVNLMIIIKFNLLVDLIFLIDLIIFIDVVCLINFMSMINLMIIMKFNFLIDFILLFDLIIFYNFAILMIMLLTSTVLWEEPNISLILVNIINTPFELLVKILNMTMMIVIWMIFISVLLNIMHQLQFIIIICTFYQSIQMMSTSIHLSILTLFIL